MVARPVENVLERAKYGAVSKPLKRWDVFHRYDIRPNVLYQPSKMEEQIPIRAKIRLIVIRKWLAWRAADQNPRLSRAESVRKFVSRNLGNVPLKESAAVVMLKCMTTVRVCIDASGNNEALPIEAL
jgi:hypothetical protein